MLGVVACGGGGGSKEAQLCAKARDLCGKDVVEASCEADVRELAKPMGKQYGTTLACGIDAGSCAELAGCLVGGGAAVFKQFTKDFEKGFDKMVDKDAPAKSKDPNSKDPNPKDPKAKPKRPRFDHDDFPAFENRGGAALLAGCATYAAESESVNGDQKIHATWSGCRDRVRRELWCKTFIDDLKCDCNEDGDTKWFFDATIESLADRAEAERLAIANCRMGFGN